MSDNSLTSQQQRAIITRDASVVLSSGAGCGKTHVLTQRYLSHLREGVEVGQIVAITFTDRAARQMRGRIRHALMKHLLESSEDAEAQIWTNHLRNLENAPISTIHAFCGTLLRQHAVEAGLDPRFAVLEEMLAGNLRVEALTICLQQLLTRKSAVADDLRELILLYGWNVVVGTTLSLIHDHDAPQWLRWLERSPATTAEEWLRFAREEFLPRHLEHWLRSRPAITRTLDLIRRYPPLPGPMSDPVATLLEQTPLLPRAANLPNAIKTLTESAKVGRVGSKAWPDATIYEQIKKAFEDFREEFRKLDGERFMADIEEVIPGIEAGQRFLHVTREVITVYREQKQRHGVVDFHDLLVSARDLLRDHPHLRARVQDRYRYLLIDELQDTDPVQMELVEYLTGGGLAGGKLFAVGDHKQSIYRFRGADVSLFQHLRRRVPLEGQQSLSVNFRSQPAILDFANTLLGSSLEEYEPLVAHHPQVSEGPCVEFLWSDRPEGANVMEARAIEADVLARRLAQMIANREPLVAEDGKVRAVRAGDIVLLFRAMSNVHLYEAALRRYGLHYYLVGGRAFFAQQEIYDLLNLLQTLENPRDSVSLAGVLRSPFCSLSDEALFVLGRHKEGLWIALFDEYIETMMPIGQRARVHRAREQLTSWRKRKDRLPIATLLGEIFRESGYDAAVAMEFLGERKLANLWKLQDLARTFDQSGLFGLAEFIARLGELVASQPREEQAATQPENADVVRLMTIHQAKGLEFPVVVIPDFAAIGGSPHYPTAQWHPRLGCVVRPPADEEPPPFAAFGWSLSRAIEELEEWNEDLRTLYVACTRPKDYLLLSANLDAKYSPTGPWMQTLASRFDLRTGVCMDNNASMVRVTDPTTLPIPEVIKEEKGATRECPDPPPVVEPRSSIRMLDIREVQEALDQADSLFTPASFEPTATEQVLRRVLAGWDFRKPDDLRERLTRFGDRYRLEEQDRERMIRLVETFTHSLFYSRLQRATKIRRQIEYVLKTEEMVLSGVIECLWQDDQGQWNVLEWITEPVPSSVYETVWSSRLLSLSMAAQAVREQLGQWPKNVALAFLYEGEVMERPASRLPHRSLMQKVRSSVLR